MAGTLAMNCVFPDLDELIALRASALARQRRAPLVPGPATTAGRHATMLGGRGLEFAETRLYLPGDDIRAIDWRQTARRGKPYTKRFQEEREQPVWFLVDQGAAMRFGSRVAFKSVIAARAAAVLAWQAAASGDRVGGAVLDEKGCRIAPARRGAHGVLALLGLLAARSLEDAPSSAATSAPPAFALDEALRQLGRLARPGSRIVILSDFFVLDAATPALPEILVGLARHHAISLVQVFDPLETAAPAADRYVLGEAGLPASSSMDSMDSLDSPGTADSPNALNSRWQIDLTDAACRAAWGAPWRARRARLAELAQQISAAHYELSTAAPAHATLAAR